MQSWTRPAFNWPMFHAFSRSLDARLDPLFCPICCFCIPYALNGNAPELPELQTRHGDFWDACMRALTAPRTPDARTLLRGALQRNIDTCYNSHTHATALSLLHQENTSDPLCIFRSLLSHCLGNCLYGIDSSTGTVRTVMHRAIAPHKRFRSSNGAWPTNVEQLFPFGPAPTLDTLLEECCTLSDDGPWWLLQVVLQLARPRVWDLLLAHPLLKQFTTVLLAIILHNAPGVRDLSIELVTTVGTMRQPLNLGDTKWLSMPGARGLKIGASLLQGICSGPYSRPDDTYTFMNPQLDAFRSLYYVALEQVAMSNREAWKTILTCVVPISPPMDSARARVPDAAVLRRLEREPRSGAAMIIVQKTLQALHFEKRCASPGCTRTALDVEDKLPNCSKCRLARYCGRECQIADWQGGHKRLCRIFVAMQSIADVTTVDQHEYASKFLQSPAIRDDDLRVVSLWAVSRSRPYMDFIRYEIEVPGSFS